MFVCAVFVCLAAQAKPFYAFHMPLDFSSNTSRIKYINYNLITNMTGILLGQRVKNGIHVDLWQIVYIVFLLTFLELCLCYPQPDTFAI